MHLGPVARGRTVVGAGRQGAIPWAAATSLTVAIAALLIVGDRGREPMVVVDGAAAPFGSFVGSATVAAGIIATWGGVLVIGSMVAWTLGSDLELELDQTYRAAGVRLGVRLVANLLLVLLGALATTAVLMALVAASGLVVSGGSGAQSLGLSWTLAGRWLLAVSFWWAIASTVAVLVRSSVVVIAVLCSVSAACLLLSSLETVNALLPTTWVGALAGFDRGASGLTDVWASGGGLAFEWGSMASGSAVVLVASATVIAGSFVVIWARRADRQPGPRS